MLYWDTKGNIIAITDIELISFKKFWKNSIQSEKD